MAPGQRHRTDLVVMLCKRHHTMLDRHIIDIEAVTSIGADGPLTVTLR